MKRAVLVGEKQMQVEEEARPAIKASELLVEIEVCGICGSDLHIYGGNHPVLKPPVRMGHEFAGKVVEVGADVRNFQLGDYVAAIPGVGCGKCEPCQAGDFNLCRELKVIGGHHPGAFANFTAVPEGNLVKLPPNFSATYGAMVESVAVAVHAARRMKSVEGKKIAVLGAGPIGLLIIQVLKAFGAKLVVASDPIASRREIASKLGADIVIDPMKENVEERIQEEVGGIGLDAAFDVAGLELTLRQALSITKNGGEIVITALFGKDPVFPMKMLQRAEKTLLGTQMYVKQDFEIAIQLMQENKIGINEMITHRFDLDHISEAFKLATSGAHDVGKIVIDVKK
ncbi:putative zinc-type alcohol dehydrogenase-like protein YdjJ [Paenibacillus plantiphilus]|uniref:Zinc-type alcohol dehydrogenase-like protein YdjJ n=1 Tax=Paenibacillus plantiphilus TaxID=2905650 RepID=A0ABN8G6U8_9BACL|nr:alcohol dehydrogenase catalytic domain-containing protein [Paenibacillus plantiphilus]CAH1201655.1 putative zinc-type alcohol dehydrogenase-like protein YdjJ [Paenibacillus plantiphilus]